MHHGAETSRPLQGSQLAARRELFMLFATGTANVIRACVKANVPRLIYTSSVEVTVDNSWNDLQSSDESQPYPSQHIYRGYAGSKKRAEQLVLAANGTRLNNGEHKATFRAK